MSRIQSVLNLAECIGEKKLGVSKEKLIVPDYLIVVAAERGNLSDVKILRNRISSRAEGKALVGAAKNGHLEIVKYLLDTGVHINDRDDENNSAIWYAAKNGHLNIVKFLIPNLEPVMVYNVIEIAAGSGHLNIVKYLIEFAMFNQQERLDGALIKAAGSGHLDIVEFLIKKGANIHTKNKITKTTPFILSTKNGHLNVVKFLIDDVDQESKNKALIISAKNGRLDFIKFLIRKEADIFTVDKDGRTILMLAVQNGHLDVVKFLVKNGLNINAKNKFGTTALMGAAVYGHLKVAEFLLENGAIPDLSDNRNQTALMLAAHHNNIKLVELLIRYHSNVNNTNIFGSTALMWAARRGHTDVVKLLIQNGADINIKNNEGETAIDIAKEYGRTKTRIEMTKMKKIIEHFFDLIEQEKTEEINQMLEKDSWLINACKDGKIAGDLIREKDLSVSMGRLEETSLEGETVKKPKESTKTGNKPTASNKKKQTG